VPVHPLARPLQPPTPSQPDGPPPPPPPQVVAHPAVIAFIQGSTLLASAALSLVLTRRLAGKPWASVLPQCALIALFTAEFWYLIVR